MLSEGAYGNVVEAEFKQVVARKGGRIVALERYALDRAPGCRCRPSSSRRRRAAPTRCSFPRARRSCRSVVQALTAAGLDTKRVQLLGTGLWDDPRIFNDPRCKAACMPRRTRTGFRNFAARYRTRYGQDPVRTATLAYDAVALVAALVKTQGPQRFSEQTLTNSSGFAGIDGLFRFRPDGTNERGLAVMRVTPDRRPGRQPAAARLRRLGNLISDKLCHSAATSSSRGLKL